MKPKELRNCARSSRKESWAVDTGADFLPRQRCRDAFDEIFLLRAELLTATPAFNCFVERSDNNSFTIVGDDPPGTVYVELFADESGPIMDKKTGKLGPYHSWRSLWLVYSPTKDGYKLGGLTSHYWGI